MARYGKILEAKSHITTLLMITVTTRRLRYVQKTETLLATLPTQLGACR